MNFKLIQTLYHKTQLLPEKAPDYPSKRPKGYEGRRGKLSMKY